MTNLSFNSFTISSKGEKESFSRFGLQATGGYAIMDDLAIVGGLGFQSGSYDGSGVSVFDIHAGARYYVIPNLYAGADLLFGTLSLNNKTGKGSSGSMSGNTISVELNAGYSYFLADRIAVEPSISYTLGLSTKFEDQPFGLSALTLNIGFLFLL